MSVGKTLNNAFEKERRFCYGEDEGSGNACKFKEGVEEVFERVCFGVDETGCQGLKGGGAGLQYEPSHLATYIDA